MSNDRKKNAIEVLRRFIGMMESRAKYHKDDETLEECIDAELALKSLELNEDATQFQGTVQVNYIGKVKILPFGRGIVLKEHPVNPFIVLEDCLIDGLHMARIVITKLSEKDDEEDENLAWVDPKENHLHAWGNSRQRKRDEA
jgi:hypothetical protein